ncbi:methyltransferase [Ancylobacter sp. VKM B-3255]|uniref:Methyltransferase n=2 Tax=Ancylobacter radicis TaxID=2836179 RepID=A0ABS5R7F5_9HYPH|nr:methyltransferase [Ancylobacter radicis]
MSLAEIGKLLHEKIGLDCETLGPNALAYAVRQRMAARAIADEAAYRHCLGEGGELQELVNAIVVPETWFFRDPRAFDAMIRHALARQSLTRQTLSRSTPALKPARLRLLSLPCSTGEEPYSMAMALFDAGFQADEFSIDAIDVSTRNIAEAERAIYGRNSFRGGDLGFRDRHFEAVEGGYRPHAAIRAQVRLRAANMFDSAALAGEPPFDIIFCRNLLIYFDRERQKQALERLDGLLAKEGLLLVGPAESGLPLLHGYASLRTPMAFAFTRAPETAATRPASTGLQLAGLATPASGVSATRRPSLLRPPHEARSRSRTPAATPSAAVPPPRGTRPGGAPEPTAGNLDAETMAPETLAAESRAAESLAAIQRAADAGRLDEAKQAAGRHVETFGPSAPVFYLLGLAHDAGDSPEAAGYYRKALYLAPNHREALAHLALLLRRRGDAAGARILSERLTRLEQRGDGR